MIGVDLNSAQQHLLLLSGETADEPDFFLGQDLRENLDQQARLGFIGIVLSSMLLFRNNEAGTTVVASSLSPVEVDARRDGLLPPSDVVIDADGANGRTWRTWLGS